MLLINFSHPLTKDQLFQIETNTEAHIQNVITMHCQLDHNRQFGEQIDNLIEQVGLTGEDWQKTPVIINPPGLTYAASVVISNLHGRMGYFPPILRLKPVEETLYRSFEFAEILNLQSVRDNARLKRRS